MASDYATGFVREPRVPAVAYARLVESLRHPTLGTAWPMRTPRQQWFGGISVFQDPLHTYSYLGSSQNKFTRSPAETGANCNHRKSHRAGKSKYKRVSIPDAAEVTMNSFRFITEQVYFVVFCRTNILPENFDSIELSVGVKALYNQPVPPKTHKGEAENILIPDAAGMAVMNAIKYVSERTYFEVPRDLGPVTTSEGFETYRVVVYIIGTT